jgi:hypothetical protein
MRFVHQLYLLNEEHHHLSYQSFYNRTSCLSVCLSAFEDCVGVCDSDVRQIRGDQSDERVLAVAQWSRFDLSLSGEHRRAHIVMRERCVVHVVSDCQDGHFAHRC